MQPFLALSRRSHETTLNLIFWISCFACGPLNLSNVTLITSYEFNRREIFTSWIRIFWWEEVKVFSGSQGKTHKLVRKNVVSKILSVRWSGEPSHFCLLMRNLYDCVVKKEEGHFLELLIELSAFNTTDSSNTLRTQNANVPVLFQRFLDLTRLNSVKVS